ncbi:MAG TPA: UTP--glucose-1-phosphate uridylyltransferase GalU [Firmicutes bacterium]|nr:UTP--glucose-1-phosphate uridylyltransferase GalU [Candidatus Fermentithermobacillaceae bacterium]
MPIKKAVLPVAGLGTRFLPATKAQPKEMLPIVDKPTIQYVVEEAIKSGVDDFLFVTGKDKRALEDYFDHSGELERHLSEKGKTELLELVQTIASMCQVHYVRQKKPLGLGHAVYCARQHVGNEYFAVLLGDDLVISQVPCLRQMMDVHEATGKPVIAVRRVPYQNVSSYGIIAGKPIGDRTWEITDLVEKPKPEDAPSDLAVIGRYILPPDIFPILENLPPGVGGEIQLTDALRELLKKTPIIGYEFEGIRYDVGDPKGFLVATVEIALSRDDLKDDFGKYLGRLVRERGLLPE